MTCQDGFLAKLCENLLGEANLLENAQLMRGDALKEFVNLLAGHLVSEILGPNMVFSFSPPAFFSERIPSGPVLFYNDTIFLLGDGEPIAICCEIFGDTPEE